MSNEIKINQAQAADKLRAFLHTSGSLENVLQQAEVLQQARSIADADVYKLTIDDCTYLLKTYTHRSLLIRWLLGRRCLQNEFNKLELVRTLPTIRAPIPYVVLDKDTLAMEFLHHTIPLDNPEQVPENRYPSKAFFQEVIAMVAELHRQKIAHGDLRRTNILIDEQGRPIMIDFATSVQSENNFFSWRRIATKIAINSDNYSLSKITKSYYPELIGADDLKLLHSPPWYLKLGRFWRRKIYRPFLRFSR